MFCGQEKILYDLLYYIVQKIKFLTAAERFLSDTRILLSKKESRSRDSPPAAGRFSGIIPIRRSAILPGGLFIR